MDRRGVRRAVAGRHHGARTHWCRPGGDAHRERLHLRDGVGTRAGGQRARVAAGDTRAVVWTGRCGARRPRPGRGLARCAGCGRSARGDSLARRVARPASRRGCGARRGQWPGGRRDDRRGHAVGVVAAAEVAHGCGTRACRVRGRIARSRRGACPGAHCVDRGARRGSGRRDTRARRGQGDARGRRGGRYGAAPCHRAVRAQTSRRARADARARRPHWRGRRSGEHPRRGMGGCAGGAR